MKLSLSSRQIGFVAVVLAWLVYANTLFNGFVYDDISIIQTNPYITDWRRIPELFAKGYWAHKTGGGGNYRPLTIITFTLEYAFWRLAPLGYHLVNSLLHVVNVALLFRLLRCYRVAPGIAGVAALVFAVHPVHTEAVANVIGRAELLGMFFGGLMWWAWVAARRARRAWFRSWAWRSAAALAYLGAVFSKENMVTLPAALWLAEVLMARRRCFLYGALTSRLSHLWNVTFPFWILAAALIPYFWLRSLAGEGISQMAGVGIVSLTGYTLWQRAIIMLEVGLIWYRLLFVGYPLRPQYDITNVPVAVDWNEWKMVGLLLHAGLVVALGYAWRRVPLVAFAIGFWFITLSIVSNVPIPLGMLVGERWLYVPSVGYAIAFGYAAWLVWKKAPGLEAWLNAQAREHWRWGLRTEVVRFCLILVVASMVGSYTYRTAQRNLDWRDNYTLFSRFIETDPQHPIGYVNVGDALLRYQPRQARAFYERALQVEPRSISANIMLTTLDIEEGAFEVARQRLERMLVQEPPYLVLPSGEWGLVHALHAKVLAELGEPERAMSETQTALRYSPEAAQPLFVIGETLATLGERDAAIEVYRRLVRLLPLAHGPRGRLGVLLLESGDAKSAERELRVAAELAPQEPLIKTWLEAARQQATTQP
ncbi:MAG: tetratricopeptide repeat protein [Acidobacteriota bacterium]